MIERPDYCWSIIRSSRETNVRCNRRNSLKKRHCKLFTIHLLPQTSSCKGYSYIFTSTTRYPQCLAATCASVVLPRPGGPHSSKTCILTYSNFSQIQWTIQEPPSMHNKFTAQKGSRAILNEFKEIPFHQGDLGWTAP